MAILALHSSSPHIFDPLSRVNLTSPFDLCSLPTGQPAAAAFDMWQRELGSASDRAIKRPPQQSVRVKGKGGLEDQRGSACDTLSSHSRCFHFTVMTGSSSGGLVIKVNHLNESWNGVEQIWSSAGPSDKTTWLHLFHAGYYKINYRHYKTTSQKIGDIIESLAPLQILHVSVNQVRIFFSSLVFLNKVISFCLDFQHFLLSR